jgi:hypothetical protein
LLASRGASKGSGHSRRTHARVFWRSDDCYGSFEQKDEQYLKERATVNLQKFTLEKNEKRNTWDLRNDKTDRLVKIFDTKGDATKGGALERAVGPRGGSVKIQKENGRFQEERTYPRGADPARSKG